MLETGVLSFQDSFGEPSYLHGFDRGRAHFRKLLLMPEPSVLYRHYVVPFCVRLHLSFLRSPSPLEFREAPEEILARLAYERAERLRAFGETLAYIRTRRDCEIDCSSPFAALEGDPDWIPYAEGFVNGLTSAMYTHAQGERIPREFFEINGLSLTRTEVANSLARADWKTLAGTSSVVRGDEVVSLDVLRRVRPPTGAWLHVLAGTPIDTGERVDWCVFLDDSLVCVSSTEKILWAYRPGDRCLFLSLADEGRFVIVDTITKMRLYEGRESSFR